MTLPIHEKRYLPLNTQLEDLDDDSDTTLTSPGKTSLHSDRRKRASQRTKITATLTWLRWGFVATFQVAILLLLLQNGKVNEVEEWSKDDTETGGDINGLYVPTKHKYTLLMPQETVYVPDMSSNINRMDVRKNWDKLMPRKYFAFCRK
jgi:hypothetical protein